MPVNLVEMAKSYLTPDIIQKAASYVGESEWATEKAMNGILPTLLAAVADQASTTDGAQQLNRMIDKASTNGGALKNLGSVFSGGEMTQNTISRGKEVLSSLFGNKITGLTDAIARFSGIRSGSASSLLALAVPLVMQLISRQGSTAGQGASSLTAMLGEQKSLLGSLLPSGIASLLGWSGYERISDQEPAFATAYTEPKRVTEAWLVPLLVLAAVMLGLLAWLLTRQSTIPTTVRETVAKMANLELPGGLKISVPEGSFNYSVYQWLASTADTTVPKRFVFDNLNFETGSTKLTPESVPTIDSLVANMKASPNVQFQLEGYTDNTGDAAANNQLSTDRANAVKGMMVKTGVAEGRISIAGYGQDKPIAPNDTEEGRAKNRRTELVIVRR